MVIWKLIIEVPYWSPSLASPITWHRNGSKRVRVRPFPPEPVKTSPPKTPGATWHSLRYCPQTCQCCNSMRGCQPLGALPQKGLPARISYSCKKALKKPAADLFAPLSVCLYLRASSFCNVGLWVPVLRSFACLPPCFCHICMC